MLNYKLNKYYYYLYLIFVFMYFYYCVINESIGFLGFRIGWWVVEDYIFEFFFIEYFIGFLCLGLKLSM